MDSNKLGLLARQADIRQNLRSKNDMNLLLEYKVIEDALHG
jgi:hypothetical protein